MRPPLQLLHRPGQLLDDAAAVGHTDGVAHAVEAPLSVGEGGGTLKSADIRWSG
jgi:hypothetical protein